MIGLPQEFLKRMQDLLSPDEYEEFRNSYESERHQALRVNTAKIDREDFLKLSAFRLRAVPWAKDGFYYEAEERPGKHPYHEAGLYYIQEPSAMAVAELADARPGERILDLCAAPGGKTTQLAAAMRGEGLLVSNEIHPARAKILAQNVERMGIPNAMVTNESPASLASRFMGFFDKVIVDAPCSGEGMFRKEEQATLQWSPENVALCADRQQEILTSAVTMLKPGGRLVYSTCTFAPEENEGTVYWLLTHYPEFTVEKVSAWEDFGPGRPEWIPNRETSRGEETDAEQIRHTFRLWPHRMEGEGHYVAVLRKTGAEIREPAEKETGKNTKRSGKDRREKGASVDKSVLSAFDSFAKETLLAAPTGVPVLFGEQLYLMPEAIDMKGLKVLRAGLHVGTVSKGRFEPSHALALALRSEDVNRSCDFGAESPEIHAYLRGETLEANVSKGWCLVTVDGYSLGWGKVSGGILKNHYPKGLRRIGG